MIESAVSELTAVVGTTAACAAVGRPRATHYRHVNPPTPKPTIPRPSVIHVAEQKPPIPLPERVTIGLAAFTETVREGLLAFCVGVGLSVVAEILEDHPTGGPAGKHKPKRSAYRHGQEDRQLTLGGRRVEVRKPRARTKDGEELELETFRFFASRDLLTQAALDRTLARLSTRRYRAGLEPVGGGTEGDHALCDLAPIRERHHP